MLIIDKLKDLYTFKKAIGIEISLDLSGEIRLTRLSKKNSSIHIDSNEVFSSVEELSAYCKANKDNPVSLFVNGKGLLIKSFAVSDESKKELTEQEIQISLPSFSQEDFYIFQHSGKGTIWIAIVKKTVLDTLIQRLQKSEIQPIQIFLGPFVFSNILSQLNVYSNSYVFNGYAITVNEDKQWEDYSYASTQVNPFNMKVGDSLIKQEFIPTYATAFSTLMNDYVWDYALTYSVSKAWFLEAKEKIKFRVNGLLILLFFFFSLLINTLLFNHYYSENIQLESNISKQSVSEKEVQELMGKVSSYEEVIKELGWNGGISKADLLERIGLSLDSHASILITKLAINPVAEKRVSTQVPSLDENRNTIHIAGRVQSLDVLNRWVRELSHMNWVESVRISKFGKSEELNQDAYNVFKIELKFHGKI